MAADIFAVRVALVSFEGLFVFTTMKQLLFLVFGRVLMMSKTVISKGSAGGNNHSLRGLLVVRCSLAHD